MNKTTLSQAAQRIVFALMDECRLPGNVLDDATGIIEREIKEAELMPIRERSKKGQHRGTCVGCGVQMDTTKRYRCKACAAAYMRDWRARNKVSV